MWIKITIEFMDKTHPKKLNSTGVCLSVKNHAQLNPQMYFTFARLCKM